MADLVLFHHVLGLTDGVVALADELRAGGHSVVTPDLFAGQRFESIEDGAAHVDHIGVQAIIERGSDAVVGNRSAKTVYAGISLGVLPAQYLAQTRPDAIGCVAMEAFVPPTEFGDGWPSGVALQVHGMADDPFFSGEGDLQAARAVVESIDDPTRAELFVYPGDRHLFVDRSIEAYDEDVGGLLLDRILNFVRRLDH
jgi:dienelactone hydrolase